MWCMHQAEVGFNDLNIDFPLFYFRSKPTLPKLVEILDCGWFIECIQFSLPYTVKQKTAFLLEVNHSFGEFDIVSIGIQYIAFLSF